MKTIPRASFDSTVGLAKDPYRFISTQCDALDSDVVASRLLLRPIIFLRGQEAAELFYDESRFQRAGAAPGFLRKTLFGEGGVQSLDDEQHRTRKAMFMSLMSRDGIDRLRALHAFEWRRARASWSKMQSLRLYDEVQKLLTRAVCAWVGIPLSDEEVERRSADLAAMFAHAGTRGPQHFQARAARKRCEAWIMSLDSPLFGDSLEARTAAVELLNVLRPTVALSVYVVFMAHALVRHPAVADAPAHEFVQEVRRFYPFFPAVIAKTRKAFAWRGYDFPKGVRVMLDLFGTNHDPRLWPEPELFDPSRFSGRLISPFELIPQGGGDHHTGHRCAGEHMTLALLKDALTELRTRTRYTVAPQDLTLDWKALPALPRDGFVITDVGEVTPSVDRARPSLR